MESFMRFDNLKWLFLFSKKTERSAGKLMKGMFYGAMSKMKEGKKLYKTKIKQNGNTNRIGADFLIDENGKILTAYYP